MNVGVHIWQGRRSFVCDTFAEAAVTHISYVNKSNRLYKQHHHDKKANKWTWVYIFGKVGAVSFAALLLRQLYQQFTTWANQTGCINNITRTKRQPNERGMDFLKAMQDHPAQHFACQCRHVAANDCQINWLWPTAVSYTHLTLPTSVYV